MSSPARRRSGRRTPQSAAKLPPRPVRVPLAPHMMWKLLIGGFSVLAVVGAGIWAVATRIPERATLAAATVASRHGFVVRQVALNGVVNQPRLPIYREVLSGGSDSMLLIDISDVRTRLQTLPWVLDATVARRWPDRLEIGIVERQPVAVWQYQGKLTLVDRKGEALPSDRLEDFADLPLVVGRTANLSTSGLMQLLASAPDLQPHVVAATWVGDRRWDLKMASGETLSLPSGDAEARTALAEFMKIDRQTPLLGRGFVRFDLRIPDKMVVRVESETGTRPKPRPMAPSAGAGAVDGGAHPLASSGRGLPTPETQVVI